MGLACGSYLESKITFCPAWVFSAFNSPSLPLHLILLLMATGKSLRWLFFFPFKKLIEIWGIC